MFSQVRKKFGDVIILLDEPGLNLHGKAQADLVRFIYEELKGKHQVIYTTHSPFMVPAEDFASIRTVEDVIEWGPNKEPTVLGTKVGDKTLSTDRDMLFPLQGALGYEITQSLFVGKHTLVVEGPGDILYLGAFSAELRRRSRIGLDPRWTICPAGGVDKIAAFISLFAGNKLHVAVLTDVAKGQKAKVDALRRSKLLSDGHVFTAGDFCGQDEADTEDLIGSLVYPELVNATFDLKGEECPHREDFLINRAKESADPATSRSSDPSDTDSARLRSLFTRLLADSASRVYLRRRPRDCCCFGSL